MQADLGPFCDFALHTRDMPGGKAADEALDRKCCCYSCLILPGQGALSAVTLALSWLCNNTRASWPWASWHMLRLCCNIDDLVSPSSRGGMQAGELRKVCLLRSNLVAEACPSRKVARAAAHAPRLPEHRAVHFTPMPLLSSRLEHLEHPAKEKFKPNSRYRKACTSPPLNAEKRPSRFCNPSWQTSCSGKECERLRQ